MIPYLEVLITLDARSRSACAGDKASLSESVQNDEKRKAIKQRFDDGS